MSQSTFYFILKAFFVPKIFKFLSWLFGHVEKTTWLERQINFEFHDVTAWLAKITIHVFKSLKLKAARQWNLVS